MVAHTGHRASGAASGRGRALGAGLALVACCVAGPSTAAAQSVRIELRPRVGDTLRMQLEQRVEMTGTTRVGGADSTMTVVTDMRVLTHAVVEQRDSLTTTMLAVTDSVLITSTSGAGAAPLERARRRLEGRRIRLRVALDGLTEVVPDPDSDDTELRSLFSQMPATLPGSAVTVGESWKRTMVMPIPGQSAKGGGTVRAVFRLDSLTRKGDIAWISMRGSLARDSAPEMAPGVRFSMAGSVVGAMTVDRQRGWVTSSRATITVRSTVTPPAASASEPMRFRMKVSQWLRSLP